MQESRTITRKSASNLALAFVLLPREKRDGMSALYAFCREVDDIADSDKPVGQRARELAEWRARIASLFKGEPSEAITTALAPAIRPFGLIEADFQDLITGMVMDAGVGQGETEAPICAPDEETLDRYCACVASAVGRVSVRIFGDSSEAAMQVAHHLGRALQLTNILRDLGEDAARGRLYLPAELLAQKGIETRVPLEVLRNTHLPAVCRALAARAANHFTAADQAMRACKPSAMRPARIMRAYYGKVLDRLIADDWRDPFTRVSLPKWQKVWLALRSMMG